MTANETGCESDDALSGFIDIQQRLFEELGLHLRFHSCLYLFVVIVVVVMVVVLHCVPKKVDHQTHS